MEVSLWRNISNQNDHYLNFFNERWAQSVQCKLTTAKLWLQHLLSLWNSILVQNNNTSYLSPYYSCHFLQWKLHKPCRIQCIYCNEGVTQNANRKMQRLDAEKEMWFVAMKLLRRYEWKCGAAKQVLRCAHERKTQISWECLVDASIGSIAIRETLFTCLKVRSRLCLLQMQS